MRPYQHGAWPRVRLAVLERDGWICQIKGKHCLTRANEADHIVPIHQGGSWFDTSNLRAACKPCNAERVGHHSSRRWETAKTLITVVNGAPDRVYEYVKVHCQPNDLIVDTAVLHRSLGDLSAALTARTRLVEQLRQGRIHTSRAWITTQGNVSTLPHHQVIEVGGDTPASNDHNQAPTPTGGELAASRSW